MKQYLQFIIFLCLAGVSQPASLFAGDPGVERTAATLFHNQQYAEALSIWKTMAREQSNAGLYFNIGLAESNLHHPAEAIYAFEQALRLCPLQATYLKALREERKKLDNPVIPLNSFFLERWYLGWITFLRPGVWSIIGLILLLSALTGYLASIKALRGKIKLPDPVIRWITIAGMIFLITALLSFRHLNKHDEGIIIQACELKQASSGESPVLRLLPAGEKVRIKDHIGDWYYIALLNLDYGWVKRECFKVISVSVVK